MSNRYFHLSLLLSWHTWALLWCLEWSAQMLSTTVFDRCLKVGGCLQCSNAQVPRPTLRSDLKRLIPRSLLPPIGMVEISADMLYTTRSTLSMPSIYTNTTRWGWGFFYALSIIFTGKVSSSVVDITVFIELLHFKTIFRLKWIRISWPIWPLHRGDQLEARCTVLLPL